MGLTANWIKSLWNKGLGETWILELLCFPAMWQKRGYKGLQGYRFLEYLSLQCFWHSSPVTLSHYKRVTGRVTKRNNVCHRCNPSVTPFKTVGVTARILLY
jgi:hypothetical protein